MSEYQIEMHWRCSACGKDNLGRHMACQGCGDPKDEREPYVMPGDVSESAQVTDQELLELAHAGENWKCAYCGSDQRNLDGSCGRCGAGKQAGTGARPTEARATAQPTHPGGAAARGARSPVAIAAAIGIGVVGMAVAGFVWLVIFAAAKPHTAVVREATWTRSLRVERRELVPRTAFVGALPSDAVEIVDAGVGVHHHDKVFDHFESETYTVTVPDGTRTETYSERESCGQTCTTSPRSCSKSCTTNKNGFATCKDVCTGGGQSCTTKYCSVTKTRQIPKTRQETRTRQVEKFRQEPRYAPQLAFRTWAWVPVFTGTKEGKSVDAPAWPTSQVAPLPDGGAAETREERAEAFAVKLVDNRGSEIVYVPKTSEEFARFVEGKTYVVGRSPSGEPTFQETTAKR